MLSAQAGWLRRTSKKVMTVSDWTPIWGGLSDDEIKSRGLRILPAGHGGTRPARGHHYDLDETISTPGWDFRPGDDKDKRRFEG